MVRLRSAWKRLAGREPGASCWCSGARPQGAGGQSEIVRDDGSSFELVRGHGRDHLQLGRAPQGAAGGVPLVRLIGGFKLLVELEPRAALHPTQPLLDEAVDGVEGLEEAREPHLRSGEIRGDQGRVGEIRGDQGDQGRLARGDARAAPSCRRAQSRGNQRQS